MLLTCGNVTSLAHLVPPFRGRVHVVQGMARGVGAVRGNVMGGYCIMPMGLDQRCPLVVIWVNWKETLARSILFLFWGLTLPSRGDFSEKAETLLTLREYSQLNLGHVMKLTLYLNLQNSIQLWYVPSNKMHRRSERTPAFWLPQRFLLVWPVFAGCDDLWLVGFGCRLVDRWGPNVAECSQR